MAEAAKRLFAAEEAAAAAAEDCSTTDAAAAAVAQLAQLQIRYDERDAAATQLQAQVNPTICRNCQGDVCCWVTVHGRSVERVSLGRKISSV